MTPTWGGRGLRLAPGYRALVECLGPVGELVERTGSMHAAHQRTHRRTGDADDVVVPVEQFVDHTDVGVITSAPTAQRQGGLFGHSAILRLSTGC